MLFETAPPRTDVSGARGASPVLRSNRSPDLDAAVDQDRRLPGGLRLLPAERALRHRREADEADGARRRAGRGARRQSRRRDALLHGRGLALAQGPRPRRGCAMVEGVKALGLETCATLGMLDGRAGAAAERRRPRLLQPQPRHLAGVLRRDHHHAHLPGSARHARHVRDAGINVCCGGIVGMGESARRSRRPARARWRACRRIPRACRSTCWCRSKARRSPARRARSVRVRPHDRGGAHRDAGVGRAPLGRARRHERRAAGAVLLRRRQLDLLRPESSSPRQSRTRTATASCCENSA